MSKNLRKQNLVIVLVALLFLVSIGYATLNANLSINGTSKIKNSTWNVHFNNPTVTEGSVEIDTDVYEDAKGATKDDATHVSYNVLLDKPGDYYEFTVPVQNEGTIDAMIDTITSTIKIGSGEIQNITSSTLPAYLNYSVTYSDGVTIAPNQKLDAGETETYKVRVEFKKNITNEQFEEAIGKELKLTFEVTYKQKDSTAEDVSHPKSLYDVLKDEAAIGTYAGTYTGDHQDSMAGVGDKAIYYWRANSDEDATAILDKNNVIFGGFCWQMIRTTDTGGVKMIYNGVPVEGKCTAEGVAQQIGASAFNPNYNSPAYVGYMYNPDTLITYKGNTVAISGSLFGTGVTYSGGNYTLTNTSTTYDTTHHYTCNNTTGVCSTVRYYYYGNDYTELNDGRNIEEALEDMLSSDDVNKTDSTIKAYIDTWYQNNMSSYTEKLEDTIFCNDRSITNLGGWNPNGGSKAEFLEFKNYNINSDLSCTNETDKYSLTNAKAKLKYPVGLMTSSEMNLLNNTNARKTGKSYWLASPNYFFTSNAYGRRVNTNGSMQYYDIDFTIGVRPAVSLATGTVYTSGEGTKNNPYVVE